MYIIGQKWKLLLSSLDVHCCLAALPVYLCALRISWLLLVLLLAAYAAFVRACRLLLPRGSVVPSSRVKLAAVLAEAPDCLHVAARPVIHGLHHLPEGPSELGHVAIGVWAPLLTHTLNSP